ncbi:MAG: UbiA family prenyltransferase [Novosphingobium sp.]|nr:UbiA family prenyltransferase [Novosphingobium sp.]
MFLKLYRIDVIFISFLLYIAGYSLNSDISLNSFIQALFIAFFPFNFIYSINSWSDRDADKINKPDRVIPSSKISPNACLMYCIFLFLLTLILSFTFFNMIFFYFNSILLILGILYSIKPFYFKKNIFLSHLTMLFMYFTAMYSGSVISSNSYSVNLIVILITVYLSFLIPLKDLTDTKGDEKIHSQNWATIFGYKNIINISFYSFCILSILTFSCYQLAIIEKYLFIIHCILTSLIIKNSDKKNIYKNILILIIINLTIYTITKQFMLK